MLLIIFILTQYVNENLISFFLFVSIIKIYMLLLYKTHSNIYTNTCYNTFLINHFRNIIF